jgi:hypothetical protein
MRFEKGPGEEWTMYPDTGGHFTSPAAGLAGRTIGRVVLTPDSKTDNPNGLTKRLGDGRIALVGCAGIGLPHDESVRHWYPTGGVIQEFTPANVTEMTGESSA